MNLLKTRSGLCTISHSLLEIRVYWTSANLSDKLNSILVIEQFCIKCLAVDFIFKGCVTFHQMFRNLCKVILMVLFRSPFSIGIHVNQK